MKISPLEELLKKYKQSDSFTDDLIVCMAEEILKIKDPAYGTKFYSFTPQDAGTKEEVEQLFKEKCIDDNYCLLLYLTESEYKMMSSSSVIYPMAYASRTIVKYSDGTEEIVKCRWGMDRKSRTYA